MSTIVTVDINIVLLYIYIIIIIIILKSIISLITLFTEDFQKFENNILNKFKILDIVHLLHCAVVYSVKIKYDSFLKCEHMSLKNCDFNNIIIIFITLWIHT